MTPLEDLELAGGPSVANDDGGAGRDGGGAHGHELATFEDELPTCLHAHLLNEVGKSGSGCRQRNQISEYHEGFRSPPKGVS